MSNALNVIQIAVLSVGFLLMTGQMSAQSIDRKVFSNGGGMGSVSLQNIAYTFGEPMIGTDMSGDPVLTKGFQQPEIIVALNADNIDLTVDLQSGHALLSWNYEGYPPASIFEVMRSEDGENFLTIGLRQVSDTLATSSSYEFVDPAVIYADVRRYIYRIRAIREDGSFLISNPVEIQWTTDGSNQISLFPNPATDLINLIIPAEKGSVLAISAHNALGQEVFRQTRIAEHLRSQIKIDVSHLPKGVYVLQVMVNGSLNSLSLQLGF